MIGLKEKWTGSPQVGRSFLWMWEHEYIPHKENIERDHTSHEDMIKEFSNNPRHQERKKVKHKN